ncbi:hypothetical protein AMECASPLE_025736 [Ameca splendens]|uniref:EGF-like domain-containing protein n=1 Tax=Ameca splendens TaxID=208324 RepID=A0ABV0Z4C2_9TELE
MTKETSLGRVCIYTLCASRPCRHGTCVAHSLSRYSCHCSEGYRGRHCEVALAVFHSEGGNSLSLSSMFAISICVMAFLAGKNRKQISTQEGKHGDKKNTGCPKL